MHMPGEILQEGTPTPDTRLESARIFNPDITGFTADTIQEAREKQILSGNIILVLGAGPSSMGGAAARELALQGATVIVSSRPDEEGNPRNPTMKDFVDTLGGNAEWRACDVAGLVTDPKTGKEVFDSQRVIQQVASEGDGGHGKLDGLIVASGEIRSAPYPRVTRETMAEMHHHDFMGPMFAVLAAVKQMRAQTPKGGRVAVIGSIAGAGNAFQVEYSSAKAALAAGVKSLAGELDFGRQRALEKNRPSEDIFVNVLAPGLVDTPPIRREHSQEQIDGILQLSGADRMMEPGEPGAMLAYLMGPYAGETSGQVIPIIGRGEVPSWLV